MNLSGKTALVTGSSDGLGRLIAIELANEGVEVILLARREEKLKECQNFIQGTNGKCRYITCDITNSEQVDEKLSEITQLDFLINNAGVIQDKLELDEMDNDLIDRIIDVNVKGTIYITKKLLPIFRKQKSGHIVNVSSKAGVRISPGRSVYVASKFAIQGFTENLLSDLDGTGIKVSGFYPGAMKTDLFKKAGEDRDLSKAMNPEDIAKILVYTLKQPQEVLIDHIEIKNFLS